MSHISRRQDQGLGKTAAGGSGGSFAGHERESASAPTAQISGELEPENAYVPSRSEIAEARGRQYADFVELHTRVERERNRIAVEALSADVALVCEDLDPPLPPECQVVLLESGDECLFSGLATSDGERIVIGNRRYEKLSDAVDSYSFQLQHLPGKPVSRGSLKFQLPLPLPTLPGAGDPPSVIPA